MIKIKKLKKKLDKILKNELSILSEENLIELWNINIMKPEWDGSEYDWIFKMSDFDKEQSNSKPSHILHEFSTTSFNINDKFYVLSDYFKSRSSAVSSNNIFDFVDLDILTSLIKENILQNNDNHLESMDYYPEKILRILLKTK